MFRFLRRSERSEEVEGTTCQWCRTVVPATDSEALFLAGAVLDPLAGWFCCTDCARQYAVRFRVQPGLTTTGAPRPVR